MSEKPTGEQIEKLWFEHLDWDVVAFEARLPVEECKAIYQRLRADQKKAWRAGYRKFCEDAA